MPYDCDYCKDTTEVWDGYSREWDTGMPITSPCPKCTR